MAINGTTGNDTLTGTKGADTIYGLAGNDSIIGDDGNDYLDGGSGNDTVDGGVGNDTIFGGAGSDSLIGGDGNDNLYGDEGSDTLDGGAGNDYLDGGDGNDTLDGGAGNDSLTGGAGNDLIYGGAGDDKINYVGDSGDDTVYGGDGNDFVSFTSLTGNKVIFGESGNDSLDGGIGNDSIDGGIGNDILTGGDGNDTLIGGEGNDSLYGGIGNDSYIGGDGNDYLYDIGGNNYFDAGLGNDTVYGDSGNDTVIAGDGNDTVYAYAGNDSVDGGNGNDTVYAYAGNDSVDGGNGDDYLSKYLQDGNGWFSGGIGNDTILGGNGNDTINGGSGNDPWLEGYAGNDFITGGDGNDELYGDEGNDTLDGGAGNDTIYGGAGNDSLTGGTGDDFLYDKTDGQDTLIGGDGNDLLNTYEGTGNKYLDGGAGNDSLYGGSGNDTLIGGQGVNEIYGGDGNDTYYISNKTTYTYDSGGTDTAYVSASFVKVPSTIEKVIYTDGAQALPYWIDALLPDDTAGLYFLTLLGASKTIYYTFPTSLPTYDTNTKDAKGWTAFNATQQSRAKDALNYISSVIGINFLLSSSSTSLNTITFANNTQTGSSGYARYPSDSFSGNDLFLDNSPASPDNPRLADGTYGALTLIHELGHTLGLEHPGNYNATGGGTDPPYLTGIEDSTTWTQMSYTDSPAQYYLQYSPLDIAALQYLYGPSPTARAGNDVYQISATTSNFIWDGAGSDTITLANINQGATVYLTPGYWGYVGNKSDRITAAGQITVNFGSIIEQLVGTSQSDALYGNEVANTIDGGAGNDLIEGWGGDDNLIGGVGNDTLAGGSGNDALDGGDGTDVAIFSGAASNYTIQFNSSNSTYTVLDKSGLDGSDTLKNVEIARFSDKDVTLATLDLVPPTIAITSSTVSIKASQSGIVYFTLSEPATNFIASDVTVSGGTLSNFTGSGTFYTATFTPTANSTANGVISVASGVFTDAAGNSNTVPMTLTMSVNTLVDTTPPTIAVSSSKSSLAAGETATLTFTLNETSTNFIASDVTASGGTLSNFSGSGNSYTATFTPAANSTTNGVVSVPSGVFTDAAGNANADGADANNRVTLLVNTVLGQSYVGTSANDTLSGGAGNDTIDGGAGTDTAQFQGKLSAYKVTMSGANGTATDSVPARDGMDTLKNIEHLRFADFDINTGIKALAGSMNTATVQRVMELYVAFFNRTPDADGLTYWLGQSKAGVSTTQIAESFYGVGVQYTSLTGFSSTMTTTDFINVVYRNVLGRADGADAGGLQYWTEKLTSGKETRGSLVSTILDAAHTYKGDATYGWVANLLDNKITVATKVAIDWGLNYLTADASVTNGMAIAKAVTPTDFTAAIALVGVPEGAVVLS